METFTPVFPNGRIGTAVCSIPSVEEKMTSKDPTRNKFRVPDVIVAFISGCHPQLNRKIRAGLRHILVEAESGESLKVQLEGLKSDRISRFRIVYRVLPKRTIEIVAIGPRQTIYEETYKIIREEAVKK
jgi:mRNA interferase RelE/StbE